jgi:hypothetical protein
VPFARRGGKADRGAAFECYGEAFLSTRCGQLRTQLEQALREAGEAEADRLAALKTVADARAAVESEAATAWNERQATLLREMRDAHPDLFVEAVETAGK